mgnify:CR=1 FL=1
MPIQALRCFALSLLLTSFGSTATAQAPSVIQLPSFSTFSYSGPVVVPDSGTGYLGGVKRASTTSSQRGLSRRSAHALGNSGAVVRPTIIDLQAMDRHILGGDPKEFLAKQRTVKAKDSVRVEEGKSLVRFARRRYKAGDKSAARSAYVLAIDILDGRLRQLAIAEYRRLY